MDGKQSGTYFLVDLGQLNLNQVGKLDDGVRVRTQVPAAVSTTTDPMNLGTLDNGIWVRTKVPAGVYTTSDPMNLGTLDDGPRVRTRVSDAVYQKPDATVSPSQPASPVSPTTPDDAVAVTNPTEPDSLTDSDLTLPGELPATTDLTSSNTTADANQSDTQAAKSATQLSPETDSELNHVKTAQFNPTTAVIAHHDAGSTHIGSSNDSTTRLPQTDEQSSHWLAVLGLALLSLTSLPIRLIRRMTH